MCALVYLRTCIYRLQQTSTVHEGTYTWANSSDQTAEVTPNCGFVKGIPPKCLYFRFRNCSSTCPDIYIHIYIYFLYSHKSWGLLIFNIFINIFWTSRESGKSPFTPWAISVTMTHQERWVWWFVAPALGFRIAFEECQSCMVQDGESWNGGSWLDGFETLEQEMIGRKDFTFTMKNYQGYINKIWCPITGCFERKARIGEVVQKTNSNHSIYFWMLLAGYFAKRWGKQITPQGDKFPTLRPLQGMV